MTARLRRTDGAVLALPSHRWTDPAGPVDERVLRRAVGPVLDIGCGPGRHVVALARAGVVTLGIDISGPALGLARRRGAPVLARSVFERIPGAGRWRTALLLDGNVGIGGDPVALLRRVASLLLPVDGSLLVELAPDGDERVDAVRFEAGDTAGPWFAWAHVVAPSLATHATAAGLVVRDRWSDGTREFAHLGFPGGAADTSGGRR